MWTSAEVDEIAHSIGTSLISVFNLGLNQLDFKGVVLKQLQSLILGENNLLKFGLLRDGLLHSQLHLLIVIQSDLSITKITVIEETLCQRRTMSQESSI